MTGRKTRALQVQQIVPYRALGKFTRTLYGTTEGTCSARVFRPVMRGLQRGLQPLPCTTFTM